MGLAGAGTDAAGAVEIDFFYTLQRKVPKRKATPLSASPALRYGATCGARGRCALRNSLRAGALRSNSRSESVHEARVSCGTRATPPAALLGASRGARGTKHPHGPLLRCAALGPTSRAQAPRAAQAKPSAAMARMDVRLFGCLAPHPCWLRLRRGGCGVSMGVEAPMPRELTRRGCPSGARSAKRVPRRTPQPPRRRFAPSLREGVADWGSPFFWVLFFGEAKKSTSPAGATPGLRPQPRHAAQSALKRKHYKINSYQPISH